MSEKSLLLGAEGHLIATLTPADPGAAGPPSIVAMLTNSGVIPRSGPHRMNVHLARRFARMGIPSIRFDMSGLGDSRRAGGTLPVIQQWVADTRAVMDAAQAHFGCDRFFMVGFCSGAEVGHLVALEDERMRGVVLWDLYAYRTWGSMLRTALFRLRRAGLAGAARKLLARLLPALRSKAVASSAESAAAEVSQVPPRDEFARRIQTLVDRGVELHFAFCGGEAQWFNHAGQFRGMFRGHAFVDKVAFTYLEKSDHLITRRESQQSFTEMVVDWLRQRLLPSPGAAPRSGA